MENRLLVEDETYLKSKGFNYSIDEDQLGNLYLRIYSYPLPEGFSQSACTLLIIFPIYYPLVKLDCFYVSPRLFLKQEEKIALPVNSRFTESFFGEDWQIFSRHMEVWRPHKDRLQNFLATIERTLKEGGVTHGG